MGLLGLCIESFSEMSLFIFDAVQFQICNTNPIKSSTIAKSPRLVALLQSWGVIDSTMNDTRRKRSQDEHNVAIEGNNYSFFYLASNRIALCGCNISF